MRAYHFDFEPLADRYRDSGVARAAQVRTAGQVETVVRNVAPGRPQVARRRPELAVSEDHVAGQPVDLDANRLGRGSNEAPVRVIGYLEREASQQLGAKTWLTSVQYGRPRIAEVG